MDIRLCRSSDWWIPSSEVFECGELFISELASVSRLLAEGKGPSTISLCYILTSSWSVRKCNFILLKSQGLYISKTYSRGSVSVAKGLYISMEMVWRWLFHVLCINSREKNIWIATGCQNSVLSNLLKITKLVPLMLAQVYLRTGTREQTWKESQRLSLGFFFFKCLTISFIKRNIVGWIRWHGLVVLATWEVKMGKWLTARNLRPAWAT